MTIDFRAPGRKIRAGVILTKGITEMLDVAPFEFFAWLDKASLTYLGLPQGMIDEGLDIELHWVTEDGGPVTTRSGASIQPTNSFSDSPQLDIVLMGAHNPQYRLSDAEKAFIRMSYDDCAAFLVICAGVFAPLEAGLFQGKSLCCPRMALNIMRGDVPGVNWVDKRWTNDGKIWSSSTLLNGTDLIRGFATHIWGGSKSGWVEAVLDAQHWPMRDVNFEDFKGTHFDISPA